MSRKREWIKFAALVGTAMALAVAFAGVVDFPTSSQAQQSEAVTALRPSGLPAVLPPPPDQPEINDLSNAFVAAADLVRPIVVRIQAEASPQSGQRRPTLPPPFDQFFGPDDAPRQPRRGQGSGFLVSADGHIVTNNHVVEGFDRFDVWVYDGRRFKAEMVGRDPDTDVAVIKIDAGDLPYASLGNSDALRVGEWVLAIGNPLDSAFSFTVTAGIVSGRGRGLAGLLNSRWSIQDFIQTDAAINPGNSGGPLVNIRGEVVGVNSAIASRTGFYSGYSFAIPINLARTVADQLIEHGKVTRAALGVGIRSAGPLDAEAVGLDAIRGVVIDNFTTDESPARRAGLREGDVIVEVDGVQVERVAQLQQLIGFKRPGDQVRVTVMRSGGEREIVSVRLMEADTQPTTDLAQVEPGRDTDEASFESKLGLAVEPLDDRVAQRIGDENVGLVVVEVDPEGPARDRLFAARSTAMDVITHVNSVRVRTVEELQGVVAGLRPGAIATLTVARVQPGGVVRTIVRVRVAGEGSI